MSSSTVNDLDIDRSQSPYNYSNKLQSASAPSGINDKSFSNDEKIMVQSPLESNVGQDVDDGESTNSELIQMSKDKINLSLDDDYCSSISSMEGSPKSGMNKFLHSFSGREVILCFWCKRICDGNGAQQVDSTDQSRGTFSLTSGSTDQSRGTFSLTSGSTDQSRGTFSLTSGNRHFCSEVCFNQCRRASFKKSKICDWCRHVRPTVAYVDFTDGDHQLQFCSDKCLNQYKMQIFCRETEAHLQLHPHLNNLSIGNNQDGSLITPDLWLKDCVGENDTNEIKDHMAENEEEEEAESTVNVNNFSSHLGFLQSSRLTSSELGQKLEPLSSSESSCASSPINLSDCEPVNLSTSALNSTKKEEKQVPRKASRRRRISSPLGTLHTAPITRLEERGYKEKSYAAECSPKSRAPRNIGNRLDDNISYHDKSQLQFIENNNILTTPRKKATIRVRELGEQTQQSEESMNCSSPLSISKTTVPNLKDFESFFIGTRPPILSGMPPILPPPFSTDIPRPQILPQLLMSQPDILRLQGVRPPHPILLTQPHLPSLSQQPPPQIHNQPHTPRPQMIPPKPQVGFPPVTVLLPLPLPIPVPIPIPIPFPILISKDLKNGEGNSVEPKKTLSCMNNKGEKENKIGNFANKISSKEDKERKKESDSNEKLPESASLVSSSKLKQNNMQMFANTSETEKSDNKLSLEAKCNVDTNKNATRVKQRRSILKYTSDVYEVNGVFVPREGGWDTVPKTTTVQSNNDKKEFADQCIQSPVSLENTNNLSSEPRCPGMKKRKPNTQHNQSLTKKKHLLI